MKDYWIENNSWWNSAVKHYCELTSLLSIRDWWVRYVTIWDTTLWQLFNEVLMLKSCIDED